MTQILQKNNLGDRIPEGAKKKKPEDQNPKKGNSSHALISIVGPQPSFGQPWLCLTIFLGPRQDVRRRSARQSRDRGISPHFVRFFGLGFM
jgi:hypothetical protein